MYRSDLNKAMFTFLVSKSDYRLLTKFKKFLSLKKSQKTHIQFHSFYAASDFKPNYFSSRNL